MAGNPVFNKFERDMAHGQYAGFGSQQTQQPQFGQYGAPQQAPYGQQQFGQPGQYQGEQFGGPTFPQQPERTVTIDDVVTKTLGLFALLLTTGAVGWFAAAQSQPVGAALWLGGMFATIAIGFMISFKKKISVPLIVAYSAIEGLFLGAISQFFNATAPGVVAQAVLATLCVFVGMFAGWKFGLVKVTDRSMKIFGFAALGYFIFGMINLVLQMTGVLGSFGFFSMGTFGIVLCLIAVALASYSLAVSFETITRAERMGAEEKTSWLLAHGLIVSLAWLYLELLRLFMVTRD